MLPNHCWLVIAEQVGDTRGALPPDVNLGLGRRSRFDRTPPMQRCVADPKRPTIPARRAGAASLARPCSPGSGGAAVPVGGKAKCRFDPRDRARRSRSLAARPRFAIRVRFALRAVDLPDALACVSHAIPAFKHRKAARDGRRERVRGSRRTKDAPPVHVGAAAVHGLGARKSGPVASADRRHRQLLAADGEGACVGPC